MHLGGGCVAVEPWGGGSAGVERPMQGWRVICSPAMETQRGTAGVETNTVHYESVNTASVLWDGRGTHAVEAMCTVRDTILIRLNSKAGTYVLRPGSSYG